MVKHSGNTQSIRDITGGDRVADDRKGSQMTNYRLGDIPEIDQGKGEIYGADQRRKGEIDGADQRRKGEIDRTDQRRKGEIDRTDQRRKGERYGADQRRKGDAFLAISCCSRLDLLKNASPQLLLLPQSLQPPQRHQPRSSQSTATSSPQTRQKRANNKKVAL